MASQSKSATKTRESTDTTKVDTGAPVLVAIGASAGGLEAISELIAGLPQAGNVCYVIAQHLSPKHKSLLHDLLVGKTELNVKELKGKSTVRAGDVYITPSNCDVEFASGKLCLIKAADGNGPKPSVDHLLTSLANSYGRQPLPLFFLVQAPMARQVLERFEQLVDW